jgi:mannose/cellobiose epimerase-like protein (N-acyl-D-glucosamine 2-epimerase family)
VLLGQADDGKRGAADLQTVDFITQRNYGIYFDIMKEASAIEAGLKEFRERKTAVDDLLAKHAKQRQAQVEAAERAEQAGETEAGQVDGGSNWSVLSQNADYMVCGALIAELRAGAAN